MTHKTKIHPEALDKLKGFKLPENIGFGKVLAPIMIVCDYADGKWGELEVLPYGPLQLDPTTKVLHYGQEIFEGLKAYYIKGNGPFLFRPEDNAKRFNLSAKRLAIPELPAGMFTQAVEMMTSYCADFIPGRTGDSLYVRPFIFATEEGLGIKPSEKFKFMVIASPSGSYFTGTNVQVMVEREAVRASPGGTGTAKAGGNYAASLLSALNTRAKGFDQTLWLDAIEKKNIEELSGMNFFAVIDGVLTTPSLTKTILSGVTRDSLLKLARKLDIPVTEKTMEIDELIEAIKSGKCTEAFCCGTAVILTPISHLGEADGTRYPLEYPEGKVSKMLREKLLDLQEGRSDDPFGWRHLVELNKL